MAKDPRVATRDLFDDADARISKLNPVELSARIAELEDELARLRRIERARKGGEAIRGKSRKTRKPVEWILRRYVENGGSTNRPAYGARKSTAEQSNITARHLGRIIAANKSAIERLERERRPRAAS